MHSFNAVISLHYCLPFILLALDIILQDRSWKLVHAFVMNAESAIVQLVHGTTTATDEDVPNLITEKILQNLELNEEDTETRL